MTLSDLIEKNMNILGTCAQCGRERVIPPNHQSLAKLPKDIKITAIGYKMRCSDCKERGHVMTTVEGAYG